MHMPCAPAGRLVVNRNCRANGQKNAALKDFEERMGLLESVGAVVGSREVVPSALVASCVAEDRGDALPGIAVPVEDEFIGPRLTTREGNYVAPG